MYEKIISRTVAGRDIPLPMKNDLTGQVAVAEEKDSQVRSVCQSFRSRIICTGSNSKNTGVSGDMVQVEYRIERWQRKIYGEGIARRRYNSPVFAPSVYGMLTAMERKTSSWAEILMDSRRNIPNLTLAFGSILLNKGNGEFSYLPNKQSGFSV